MNNITRFLDLYKDFESWATTTYQIEKMSQLEEFSGLGKYRSRLSLYRKVRNFLSHNDVKRNNANSLVTISSKLVDDCKKCIEELRSPIKNNAIMIGDVYCRAMSDKVKDTMDVMYDCEYTHVPIMDGELICGVFSERSVFELSCNGIAINSDMTFNDIKEYFDLEIKPNEPYAFVPQSITVPEVLSIFADAKEDGYRLDLIFITEDGTPGTPLIGMVSAWDMAAL